MAELAGESREALAAAIFVQYAFAPFSITLWCAYALCSKFATHTCNIS